MVTWKLYFCPICSLGGLSEGFGASRPSDNNNINLKGCTNENIASIIVIQITLCILSNKCTDKINDPAGIYIYITYSRS